MPPLSTSHPTGWRVTVGWILTAIVWLAADPALADHGFPAPARTGFGWMSWLLVAGAIAAVSLAAWAFFAPDRSEDGPEGTPRDGSASGPSAR